MKSIFVKIMVIGFLLSILFAFCPLVLPLANQVFAPPVVHKPKPVIPPPGVRHLKQVEDFIFERTNQIRQAKGLASLSQDEDLTNVARSYSDDMLIRRFFDHTTPEGVSFDERIANHYHHRIWSVGENIWSASGYSTGNPQKLAKEMVDDWMSSPGHRENLLAPSFTHLGVGVSAKNGAIRATQEFVRKSSDLRFGDLIRPWLIKINKL